MPKQESKEGTPVHKSSKEDPSIRSEKNAEGSKKIKSFTQKAMSSLKKKTPFVLMAALFLTIGGPVGIVLGLLLLGFLAKKPLFKMAKKGFNLLKKLITRKKRVEENSKLGRVTETSTLEMDKKSLKSMGTKPDGVSVKKLPEDQSKATTNGDKLAASKFENLGTPQVKLSKRALERRNSLPSRKKSNPLAKSKTVPKLKKPSPA